MLSQGTSKKRRIVLGHWRRSFISGEWKPKGGLMLGLLILALSAFPIGCSSGTETKTIVAFCGAASEPALEEAARAFEKKTEIKVELHFSGSGTMLSEMKISKRGDLYIPGSPDYIYMAEGEGLIDPQTVEIIAYLVPAISVQKGNPKNIRALEDLTKPGVRVGIGNPEAVCVGLYAVEVLEYNHLLDQVQKNIVTHAESCSKTAALIGLKEADAIIGWDVFSKWNPDTTETVYLKPEQIPRLAYVPAAISTYSEDRKSAQEFIDFLVSKDGQAIFARWGYITTEEEARKYAPKAQIGGEYKLPTGYQPPIK